MNSAHGPEDIITAIATPPGIGALGIIRISGSGSLAIVNSIFKGKDLTTAPANTIHYGYILDGKEILDEVMISVFRAPHSFTKEESAEISCHGSSYILQRILELLVNNGCRLAEPGEFTMRAFMHGRIDLSQAEAVADLIASENEAQHRIAMQQLRGGFAKEIESLRQELIDFTALIELELDFGEEDVEFANRDKLISLMDKIAEKISSLIQSFRAGNAIKKGIPIVIAGRPNAGKSTLLNALLNEERAIVSNIAGTTRDVIEEQLIIDGVPFRFMDTAGIREAKDEIEKIGIDKTFEKIDKGSVVLYLFDPAVMQPHEVLEEVATLRLRNENLLVIANKLDEKPLAEETRLQFEKAGLLILPISAKEKTNLSALKKSLVELVVNSKSIATGSVTVSNLRHYEALVQALSALQQARTGITGHLSGELVAFDLRETLKYLGLITGQITTDDLLGSIFSRFCIGK